MFTDADCNANRNLPDNIERKFQENAHVARISLTGVLLVVWMRLWRKKNFKQEAIKIDYSYSASY